MRHLDCEYHNKRVAKNSKDSFIIRPTCLAKNMRFSMIILGVMSPSYHYHLYLETRSLKFSILRCQVRNNGLNFLYLAEIHDINKLRFCFFQPNPPPKKPAESKKKPSFTTVVDAKTKAIVIKLALLISLDRIFHFLLCFLPLDEAQSDRKIGLMGTFGN